MDRGMESAARKSLFFNTSWGRASHRHTNTHRHADTHRHTNTHRHADTHRHRHTHTHTYTPTHPHTHTPTHTGLGLVKPVFDSWAKCSAASLYPAYIMDFNIGPCEALLSMGECAKQAQTAGHRASAEECHRARGGKEHTPSTTK
jgi:hypothetical protein